MKHNKTTHHFKDRKVKKQQNNTSLLRGREVKEMVYYNKPELILPQYCISPFFVGNKLHCTTWVTSWCNSQSVQYSYWTSTTFPTTVKSLKSDTVQRVHAWVTASRCMLGCHSIFVITEHPKQLCSTAASRKWWQSVWGGGGSSN